jgi:predicted PurR-regulated permease PerM
VKVLEFVKKILSKDIVKSLIFILFVALFLYLIQSILDLVLLTFILTYLINSLESLVTNSLEKYIPIKKGIITIILYVVIFLLIVIAIYNYVPVLTNQIISIIKQVQRDYLNIKPSSLPNGWGKFIVPTIKKIDFKNYTQSGVNVAIRFASGVGKWTGNIFFALILSLFFMLEKDRVKKFVKKFEYSKISGIYKYFKFFGTDFLNSFGKVIKAQVVIAMVNTIISVIFLAILGFPKLLALGFMIFILSLIPVAGALISLIPLALIAFKIGGLMKIFYILIMVAVIHIIESYILNPKLMSEKTKLPIFFTFVVLIFSEHFMGIWGLLLGIPLFIFFLDVFGINLNGDENLLKKSHASKKE